MPITLSMLGRMGVVGIQDRLHHFMHRLSQLCVSATALVVNMSQLQDMVVSLNRGTPIWTPKYYNPYYGDPQNGTPNFGKA